jgi:hypothetical protein
LANTIKKVGLNTDETVFYDDMEANDSSVDVLGDETLKLKVIGL